METPQSMAKHAEHLKQACQALELNPSDKQQTQLLEYLSQLLKWNKTYNLTAIRDAEQALIQHIFDSLSVVPILNKLRMAQEEKGIKVLDVGSGAGLPGVVIAIMMTNAKVTCVDTVEKKMSFVRQMISVLKLENLQAVHARVENMVSEKYDVVTSRAFASLKDFANLAGHHVDEKGYLLAMKGKEPTEEIEDLLKETNWKVQSIQSLLVPQLNAQRCLVWMNQKGTQ